jgi:hypothetical protein
MANVATVSVPAVGSNAGTAEIKDVFESLAAEWKKELDPKSNIAQMVMLKPYQRIIGMGPPVVPLILDELRREPDHWFWALEAITGVNPVSANNAGKVAQAAQEWIEWGEMHADVHCTPSGEMRQLFSALAEEWLQKSQHMSNNFQSARLMSYQRIIGMGWPAVPLILEELGRAPRQWFWALQAITGENPVSPEIAGKVMLSAQAWIDWGKARGLIAG